MGETARELGAEAYRRREAAGRRTRSPAYDVGRSDQARRAGHDYRGRAEGHCGCGVPA